MDARKWVAGPRSRWDQCEVGKLGTGIEFRNAVAKLAVAASSLPPFGVESFAVRTVQLQSITPGRREKGRELDLFRQSPIPKKARRCAIAVSAAGECVILPAEAQEASCLAVCLAARRYLCDALPADARTSRILANGEFLLPALDCLGLLQSEFGSKAMGK